MHDMACKCKVLAPWTICLKLPCCKLEIPMVRREGWHLVAASGFWGKKCQNPFRKASCLSLNASNTQLTTARFNSCKALELIAALLSRSPHEEDSIDASQMELAQRKHQHFLENIHFRKCFLLTKSTTKTVQRSLKQTGNSQRDTETIQRQRIQCIYQAYIVNQVSTPIWGNFALIQARHVSDVHIRIYFLLNMEVRMLGKRSMSSAWQQSSVSAQGSQGQQELLTTAKPTLERRQGKREKN